jgi:hypothetical protein
MTRMALRRSLVASLVVAGQTRHEQLPIFTVHLGEELPCGIASQGRCLAPAVWRSRNEHNCAAGVPLRDQGERLTSVGKLVDARDLNLRSLLSQLP